MPNLKRPAIPAYLALVERRLAQTEDEAKRLILAGRVFLGENRIDKSSQKVKADGILILRATDKFVSRGGLKLEGCLREAKISVMGKACLDIGASTGGFTDCLLQNGAKEVVAVDVGKGLLDDRLRRDLRVTAIESENFRTIPFLRIGRKFDLVVIDVSFISLAAIIPRIAQFMQPDALLITLFKPQFEVAREFSPKGVVKNQGAIDQAIDRFVAKANALKLTLSGRFLSQIHGPKGNQEIFLTFIYSVAPAANLG